MRLEIHISVRRAAILVVVAATAVLQSCSPNKFIAEGEALYRGAEIEMTGPDIPQNEKLLKQSVNAKLQPKPNRKFLGLFYTKIWLYEKVQPKEGKEKSLKHWLKNKIGEKPVLVSQVDTTTMNLVIQKLYQDYGLFHTNVEAEIIAHRRQAKVLYKVDHMGAYTIGKIRLPKGETAIDSIVRTWDKFEIDSGDVYTLLDFKEDRAELARHIRDQGYFDFSERNILFLVDTSWADHQFAVDLRIRSADEDTVHRKYHIGRVDIYPTHESDVFADTLQTSRTFGFKDFTIHQNYQYVGKKALDRFLLIRPGELFSVKKHEATLNRFINTGIFRYVNVEYNKRSRDSLDVSIYLTPTKYQGINVDVEATTSNRSFLGSSLTVGYSNGNLFRGAEYFTLTASGGTEFQIVNDAVSMNILNFRLDARLEVPGIIPILRWNNPTEVMPRTYLEISENYQKWLEYYTYNSLKFGAGYHWRSRGVFSHNLEVLALEYVTLINKTEKFDEIVEENPLLRLSFETNVIFGRSYDFTVTSRRNETQRSYIYYLGGVEMAGNIGYISGRILKKDKTPPYEVFGIPFANFAKLSSELRHYWEISKDMTLVSRIGIGVGFAYGNSEVLPYSRQLFMGGPNTLRAFEFRTVGPGTFTSASEEDGETNPIEQAGDIQLMLNLEYRFTMYRFLHGALFMDAGNVWLRKEDPDRPGGEFAFDQFYRELALGTGFGIRLDFDFFAIRVDLGIPLYKPFNEEGEQWIPSFPETGFRDWRKANWTWNIAIGYPF